MSCCGQKRAELSNWVETDHVTAKNERAASRQTPVDASPAYFQYVGHKALTVLGRETHQVYRFEKPGAIIAVDRRDQRALEAVPVLRLVKKELS